MRPGIPWGRVGVEGLVIVSSILLAFAVQAWWEGQRERRLEATYLRALQGELMETDSILMNARTFLDRHQRNHEALVAQFSERTLASPDSLILWLSSLSYPSEFNPPTAVLTDLQSSGGMQLIQDDTIRLGIARYEGLLQAFQLASDQAWATWAQRIQPYLEGRVSRVDRLLRGAYPRSVPFSATTFEPRYSEIFADQAFQDMIAERWIRLDSNRNTFEEIEATLDDLTSRIRNELSHLGG